MTELMRRTIRMIKGIDISSWQGNIDFAKVKASGIDFVITATASIMRLFTYCSTQVCVSLNSAD